MAVEKPEGFWKEFFLLKPDPQSLGRMLDEINPGDLLHLHQAQTRQLFARAVAALRNPYGVADLHALEVRIFVPCRKKKKKPKTEGLTEGFADAQRVHDFDSGQKIHEPELGHH